MDLFEQARQYAVAAHGEQKYGQEPYEVHLKDVDGVLVEFGFNTPTFRAAGQLHDVVEDTNKTLTDLSAEFPEEVVFLVDGVTSVPGPNRKIRNAGTYPKIAAHPHRIALKLADRISNARRSFRENGSLLSMYKKEYPDFRRALYTPDSQLVEMWAELDRILK